MKDLLVVLYKYGVPNGNIDVGVFLSSTERLAGAEKSEQKIF